MTDTAVSGNNKSIAFQGKPTRERTMGKLTAKARKALPKKDFAGPDGSYPIPDESHGRDALARASEYASPKVDAEIKRKVTKKFPSMNVKSLKKRGQISDRMAEKHRL